MSQLNKAISQDDVSNVRLDCLNSQTFLSINQLTKQLNKANGLIMCEVFSISLVRLKEIFPPLFIYDIYRFVISSHMSSTFTPPSFFKHYIMRETKVASQVEGRAIDHNTTEYTLFWAAIICPWLSHNEVLTPTWEMSHINGVLMRKSGIAGKFRRL